MEASTSRPLKFLEFPPDLLSHMESLGWRRTKVPIDQYQRVLNEEPSTTIGYRLPLVLSAQIPDDIVYEITKALCEHADETRAVHRGWRAFDPRTAWQNTGWELHPGAARYYREMGYMD
jgi:TRAP transporter TAXI family solute receptor